MSHKAKSVTKQNPLTKVLQPVVHFDADNEVAQSEVVSSPAESDNEDDQHPQVLDQSAGMSMDTEAHNLQVFLTSGNVSLTDSVDPFTDSTLQLADPFALSHVSTRSIHDGIVHVSFVPTEATQWLNSLIEDAEGSYLVCNQLFKAAKAEQAQRYCDQFFENSESIDAFFSSKWSDIRSDHEDLITTAKRALEKALDSMYAVVTRYRDHLARSAPVIPVTSNSTTTSTIASTVASVAASKVSVDWSREKIIQIDNQGTGPASMDPHEFVDYFLSLVRPKKILEIDYTPVFTNFIHDVNTRRLFEKAMFHHNSENGQPLYESWDACVRWINHRWLIPQDKYKPLDKLCFAQKYFLSNAHPTIDGFIAFYYQKISDCHIESVANTPIDALLGRMFLYQLPRKLQEALVAELSKQDLQRMIDDPNTEGNLLTLERVSALANLLSRSRPDLLIFDKTIPFASVGMVQMSNTYGSSSQENHSTKKHKPNKSSASQGSALPNSRPAYVPRHGDHCVATEDGSGPDPNMCYSKLHAGILAAPPLPAHHAPAMCKAMHPPPSKNTKPGHIHKHGN